MKKEKTYKTVNNAILAANRILGYLVPTIYFDVSDKETVVYQAIADCKLIKANTYIPAFTLQVTKFVDGYLDEKACYNSIEEEPDISKLVEAYQGRIEYHLHEKHHIRGIDLY